MVHLAQRDAALRVVARAPLAKIEAFKKRMGCILIGSHHSAAILTTITE